MAAANKKAKIDQFRENYGLPLAIIVMFILWFMPTPAGLSIAGKKALVLFAGVFILYLTKRFRW